MPKAVKRRVYMGIDPGTNGGIAVLSSDGSVIQCHKLPDTDSGVFDLIIKISLDTIEIGTRYCYLERVGGFMGDGRQNVASAHTMFNFGRGVGVIIGSLWASNTPYEEVMPKAWQKGIGMSPRTKVESSTQWKNRLKDEAQRLFPSENVTLAKADCLLIAEHLRRTREGIVS